MPRPTRQTVYGPAGSSLDDVRRTLQPHINALLSLANQGNEKIERVLIAIREGRTPVRLPGVWAEAVVFAVLNVISNVRSGDYHLRRCVDCAQWMLVKDRRRQLCPTCRKRRHAKKEARRRRVEQENNKRAVVTVRRKGTRTFS